MVGFNDAVRIIKERQRANKMRARIAPNWGAGLENDKTPINAHMLPVLPGAVVELSPAVYKKLQEINKKTITYTKEIPFLLFGVTDEENNYSYFDEIIADDNVNRLKEMSASHNNLLPHFQRFIENAPRDKSRIVAHGHTHIKLSHWYHNFSVGDLDAYAEMREKNHVFATGQIELCSVVLVDGQYNFLFFDPNYNEYFRMPDVYVDDVKLPSYGGPAYVGRPQGRGRE